MNSMNLYLNVLKIKGILPFDTIARTKILLLYSILYFNGQFDFAYTEIITL